jgi:hypothetical protein
MLTYDPDASTLISEIPPPSSSDEPLSVNEELARQALSRSPEEGAKTVPTGLLRLEKKVDESQMADFSTSIEELMQNEVQGPPMMAGPSAAAQRHHQEEPQERKKKGSDNPFGLTNEQFQAALAGISSVIAFSKPVQSRLRTMVPKFVGESGDVSLTGLAVTALIAALVFYIIKKYLVDKN